MSAAKVKSSRHLPLTLVLLLSLTVLSIRTQSAPREGMVLAPGYGALTYVAPTAGSYQLPTLGPAADGEIIDSHGQASTLHQLSGDKVVLLSFIYTRCSDVNGCPLASYVMAKVQQRLIQDESIRHSVRFLSLSFDPDYDTPKRLASYRVNFTSPHFDWRFLTTVAEKNLLPILDGYDQWRQKSYDDKGAYQGTVSHILRVFLIDKNRNIRNIYSTGFLHPDTVLNDIRTLLLSATPVNHDDVVAAQTGVRSSVLHIVARNGKV